MANVLNRQTNAYLLSVNTPDYDPSLWVINPDLSAVAGYPSQYWIINADDTVSLMTPDQQKQADLIDPYAGLALADAITQKCAAVNDYRDQFLNGGWSFNGVAYDSDPTATQNIAGTQTLINAGYTLPSDFTWRAKDNTDHPFTNATFLYFYIASCQWRSAAFQVSWKHKANISAMTNVQDVATYDFTQGWIPGYNLTADGLSPVNS